MFDINYDSIESDFAAGYVAWVRFQDLDCDLCRLNGKRVSFEFRDGFEAAAKANEASGDRPTEADAVEAAAEHRRASEKRDYDFYCLIAD